MTQLRLFTKVFFAMLVLFTPSLYAQSPTDAALGFNVFVQKNATFITNETEGPVAIGGNLTLGGSYQVSTNQTGTYTVGGVKVTMLVGGKVIYSAGTSLQVNQNGYVKIGDSTGSYVWYKDNNNAYSPIRITPGANYNASPKISLAANSQTLGVSASSNPVFQGGLIDFASAFSLMKFKSGSLRLCNDNTVLTNANGAVLPLPHTGLPSQVKINLANGINYLNLTAADMNAVQDFTYNTQPSATRILIVNVNAPGTFNWNVWNSAGIGGSNSPYILYNFYNTTTLTIQGNGAIRGTVFAPYADITKTSSSDLSGQVIAQSYYQNGGLNGYFPFTPTVAGCAARPIASFTINVAAQCISGNSFVFTKTTPPGPGMSYKWSFGDGGTSTMENPTKTYTTAGTYSVKLVVAGFAGTDSITKTVTVYPNTPIAGFSINDTAQYLPGNSFVFTPTLPTTGNSYNWSLGDGTFSNDPGTSKTYSTAGTYSVKQVVTPTNGCKDSVIKTIIVKTPLVTTASFTVNDNTQCSNDNVFQFTSTSLGTSLTQKWDFGDGSSSTLMNPVKTYPTAGTYTVKLVVSGLGGKDSTTTLVTVYPLPQVGFTPSDTAQFLSGNSFTFTPDGSTAGNTYKWALGDGTFSNVSNPTKSYAAIGSYEIRQVITSANGCMDSTTKTIVVKSPSLTVASFAINADETQCLSSNTFSFLSLATGSGTLTYAWSFGDGNSSSLMSPVKTYTTAGTYTIKLVVTGAGGIDSVTRVVTVAAAPATGFTVNDSSQFVVGNNFGFTTTGSTTGNSYNWTLGDGSVSSDLNPLKSYLLPGTYAVTQHVISVAGCIDSFSRTVIVKPVTATVASFSLNNTAQCISGNQFTATNVSSGTGILSALWDFGDGTISDLLNPSKTYSAPGTYTIKLKTAALGGIDSMSQTITVNMATAGFSVNDTTQMVLDNQFAFNTDSLSGYTYFWSFGDSTTAAIANPVKSYTTTGDYIVKQTATSPQGCKDSITLTVSVTPVLTPVAGFAPDTTTTCLGNSFTFFNASSGVGTLSYLWSFGDGTTSTDLSPSKIYITPGTYTVKLVVSGMGGLDSVSKTVNVIANAVKGFTVNNSIQTLTGNSFSFNTTTAATGNTYKWTFGDNSVSTDINPLKTYFTPGSFRVNQIVTAANGCKDSVALTVIVESDSVGSGNGGGLESRDLGGAVTRRDYQRQKNNIDTRIDYKRLPVFTRPAISGQFNKTGNLRLADMVPQHLDPNDVPRISTPEDLVNLTIALEVLSIDYTIDNKAKAAVLGIKTEGTAYNHTKPVCDRLRGATLVSVDTVHIQQYQFTRFALKQPDNTVEYGIAFVAGTKEARNSYSLQTHWLVSEYVDEDTMYTFQVWSTQPSYTEKLVNDILNNLQGSMPLIQLDQPTLPKVYITHGERKKENLILTIQNTTEETFGKVVFRQRLNEQSPSATLEVQLVLARFEKKDFSIPVKDGYEYEGVIFLENLPEDAIYMADGNWGLDYDRNNTTISEYTIGNNQDRVYNDNTYSVYRNVSVKCKSNDYLTVYKAVSQGNAKTDLTAYNNLTFYAKGSGAMSIRLTKDAIVSWNNQYTTNITLDTAGKVYNIRFSDLHSTSQSGPFIANDIKLLGFTFVVSGTAQKDLDFFVKDVSFNTVATGIKESFTLEPMGVYPNPNAGSFSVSFATENNENLELVVTDLLGKTVLTKKVTALAGNNITRVDLETAQQGYYLVSLKGKNKPYRAVKILVY